MMPWYRFLTDLGDRDEETAIRSNCGAALAIWAETILISRTEIRRAALAIMAEKFLLPEQKWIDGDMHARPVGDIFSEHLST